MFCIFVIFFLRNLRYEREINRAERPAVRLIQEHDASPAQAMVLCVSSVQMQGEDEVEIELTDGWYRIRTVPDKALARAARKEKLVVGRKIAVAGARVRCFGLGFDHKLKAPSLARRR